MSLLDALVGEKIAGRERSYSAPFSLYDFDKTTVVTEEGPKRVHAKLKGAGQASMKTSRCSRFFERLRWE